MAGILTPAEAAYVAGIIDGEGCVQLRKLRAGTGNLHSRTATITVSNTRLELMHWLLETTGCGTVTRQQRKPPCKPCYTWRIGANAIRELMPQVAPYMVLKQERTLLILRYLELRKGHPALTEEQRDEVMRIFAEVAQLNAMGIHTERDQELQEWYGKQICSEERCVRWCYPGQPFCYRHWVHQRVGRVDHCRFCGKEIEVVYQKRKQFCSSECRSKQFYKDKVLPTVAAEVEAREAKPCPSCGKPVDRKHYARKVFCSDHCRESVRARIKKLQPDFSEKRTCPQCGVEFEIGRYARKQVYCTPACGGAAYRERQKNE